MKNVKFILILFVSLFVLFCFTQEASAQVNYALSSNGGVASFNKINLAGTAGGVVWLGNAGDLNDNNIGTYIGFGDLIPFGGDNYDGEFEGIITFPVPVGEITQIEYEMPGEIDGHTKDWIVETYIDDGSGWSPIDSRKIGFISAVIPGSWNNVVGVKMRVWAEITTNCLKAGGCGFYMHLQELRAFGPAPPIVAPTVTTDGSSNTDTTATLNGSITDTGGEDATLRGFEWGTVNGGPYPNDCPPGLEGGSFGISSFSCNLGGLAPSTTYYFKAKASNPTGGLGRGNQMDFTTDAAPGVIPCAAHDVWGYAWSENIGWISFSCQNCDSNFDGNLDGGSCGVGSSVNYGVDIDGVGNLSGYAWSENIGWISFNNPEFGICPVGFGPCQPNISLATGAVTGYARVCSVFQSGCTGALRPNDERGGWDGWIRLSGTWANGVVLPSAAGPTSEFEGWAWGGDDAIGEEIIGWISFNSATGGGPTDYAVETGLIIAPPNNPPTAVGLNITEDSYCFVASPPVFLNWTFSDLDVGDSQSAYRIQIDNSGAGFPSSEIDTGKVISASNTYAPVGLSFNTIYWWRLMVWDDSGAANDFSSWITPPAFSTDPRWPNPSFTWDPDPPPAEWDTQFDSTVSDCPACTYLWEFGTGDTDVIPDPIYAFPALAVYNVSLRARSGGLSCTVTNPVGVGAALPLPTWIEITPF